MTAIDHSARAHSPIGGSVVKRISQRSGLTAEEVRHWLGYDPVTGQFIWKRMSSRKKPPGSTAGWADGHGYIGIRLLGVCHAAHRLAWLWMTGTWPKFEIDHINSDPSDNRWANLRDATHAQNLANRKGPASHNKHGTKCVWWDGRRKRWRAAIVKEGRAEHLGYFTSQESARAAYNLVAPVVHGQFARTS